MTKLKIRKKKRKHMVSIVVLSFLIIGNLLGINNILAASSVNTSACLSICETEPCPPCSFDICGDSIINDGEICDGNTQSCVVGIDAGVQLCQSSCDGWGECVLSEFCGDGIINGVEICDDGNNIDCDACRSDCTRLDNVCGDGYLECGEECDVELGLSSGYRCSNQCSLQKITSSALIFIINKEAETTIDEIISSPIEEEFDEDNKREEIIIELSDIKIEDEYILKNKVLTEDPVIIFENDKPSFSGKISVAYSYVYFQINEEKNVSGSVRADENGYWSWQIPTSLESGKHKIYISVGDKENRASDIYYSLDFETREKIKIETEKILESKTEAPTISEVSQEEINEIKDALKIHSSLEINNLEEITPFSRLVYDFRLTNNKEEKIETSLFLRIKNDAGLNVIEKKYSINFNNTFSKKDYIFIPEDVELGVYSLESFLNIDGYYIFNKTEFKILEKEEKSYWSALNTTLYKKELMLGLLIFSLLIFISILFFETRALFRLKNIAEVDEDDLESQLV